MFVPRVGSVWVWEPDKPHAREAVRVVDVRWNGEEWWIASESATEVGGPVAYNDLSRWAEAAEELTETWTPPEEGGTFRRFEDDTPEGSSMAEVGGERDLVARMASAMFDKLEANTWKRHWREATPLYLVDRLRDEVEELWAGVILGEDVWGEAADVANFAAFIADVQEENRRRWFL